MAYEYYLQLDGIKGECTADGFKDQWDVVFLDGGTCTRSDNYGTGDVSNFNITMLKDKLWGKMNTASGKGEPIKGGKLVKVETKGDSKKEVESWKFTNIRVKRVSSGSGLIQATGTNRQAEPLTIEVLGDKIEYKGSGTAWEWDAKTKKFKS